MNEIIYPAAYAPSVRPVFVRNEIHTTASPEAIWKKLIDAKSWPAWYRNSSRIEFLTPESILEFHTRFRWTTFGFRVTSEIVELVPNERIAWTATAFGIHAYHAWLIMPTPTGCHIITEETQQGFICVAGKYLMPNRMSRWHQNWLETLSQQAKGQKPAARSLWPF